MKNAKRLIGLLVSAVILATAPLTVMALPAGGYVPTSATVYELNYRTNKWERYSRITYNYKNDGRLTKRTEKNIKDPVLSYTERYTWKGDYIIKYSDNIDTTTYKYTKIDREGGIKTLGIDRYTINEKGQLIKAVYDFLGSGYGYRGGYPIITVYQYYGNGNLKSETTRGDLKCGTLTYGETTTYNKKGFITSYSLKSEDEYDIVNYKYTTKKGKLRQVVINAVNSPDHDQFTTKIVFQKWKYVEHVRNCDAYGHTLDLWSFH